MEFLIQITGAPFNDYCFFGLYLMKKIFSILFILLFFLGPAGAVTKTAIKSNELMKAITDDLTLTYSDYSIEEAFKVNNNGIISYEVILKQNKVRLIVYYSDKGNFIRKTMGSKTKQKYGVKQGKLLSEPQKK
jgi:hypothetical protein